MPESYHLIADILSGGGDDLETTYLPTPRAFRFDARRRLERVQHAETLAQILGGLPGRGESIHVVSGSKFDFWTVVPFLVRLLAPGSVLYCSTWTLSRTTVVELCELWDAGTIAMAHFLTGEYFKRRETSVYATLLEAVRARGGRFRAFANHAKVLLIGSAADDAWLIVEGSANLTGNPRLEQYVFTRDRGLYDFHRAWMEEVFQAKREETL